MDAASPVAGLEPASFWTHFERLTRIARPPRGEDAAIEHVRKWAQSCGLEVAQDTARNLVVRVPGTPGREDAPIVVLQGHLDMVCERRPDSPYDAAEGRIRLVRRGEWLGADGTTLGADDGVAIAAMLALADGGPRPHGPLELLMTVAEEVGLEGVNGIDPGLIHGRILLNLDGEADATLTVGCAGSTDSWLTIPGIRTPSEPGERSLTVTLGGCLGGHSGGDIAAGRANAVKALGAVLSAAFGASPFRLSSLTGGRSRNAIPRDATATCLVPAVAEAAFRTQIEEAAAALRALHGAADPGIVVAVSAAAADPEDAWETASTRRLLDAIVALPTGPLSHHPAFPGVVETSSSLGEATTDGDTLILHSLSRSSDDAALTTVLTGLEAIARLAGGGFRAVHNYRAWQPDLASALLATARSVYEHVHGSAPAVTLVHGGIEPAVLGTIVPGLQMLSFGPWLEAPHSPDERLSIPSVGRFWRFLTALLDVLSADGALAH